MEPWGWVLLIGSWTALTALASFCLYRIWRS